MVYHFDGAWYGRGPVDDNVMMSNGFLGADWTYVCLDILHSRDSVLKSDI